MNILMRDVARIVAIVTEDGIGKCAAAAAGKKVGEDQSPHRNPSQRDDEKVCNDFLARLALAKCEMGNGETRGHNDDNLFVQRCDSKKNSDQQCAASSEAISFR